MEPKDKKVYVKPEITFETDLETKAGSPGPRPCESDINILDWCE